jgi:hypothetical protein
MLGFIIGTACLIGLGKMLHGRCAEHRHRWCGWPDGPPRIRDAWRPGRRRSLFWLSDRLEATPGQERAIAAALERVAAAFAKVHGDVREAAVSAARGLRADHLDRDALQQQVSQAHAELVHIEEALLDAVGEIHEALEPHQRRTLAELLERLLEGDWRGASCGHGYGHI